VSVPSLRSLCSFGMGARRTFLLVFVAAVIFGCAGRTVALNPEDKVRLQEGSAPSEADLVINEKLEFFIPYYEWFESFAVRRNASDGALSVVPWRRGLFVSGLALILVLQFYLTISISSDYLTPSLAHLSSLLCMSADMAGLTFLAFGNGAPDFFTALLGAGEAPEMILSSGIGSGLFLVTFVLGLLIVAARQDATLTMATANVATVPTSGSRVKIGRGTFWRNVLMYAGCVAALAGIVLARQIVWWQAAVLLASFAVYLSASIFAYYYRRPRRRTSDTAGQGSEFSKEQGAATSDVENNELPDLGRSGLPGCLELEKKRFKLQQYPLGHRLWRAVQLVSGWDGMSWMGKGIWVVTSPFRLVLTLTIFPLPPIECTSADGYGDYSIYRMDDELLAERLVAQMLLGRLLIPLNPGCCLPLLAWFTGLASLLIARTGWLWTVFLWASVSSLLGCLLHLASSGLVNPGAAFARPWQGWLARFLSTFYAFIGCLAWIYVVSNELVAVLSSLGLVCGVSRTILGGLVLAWGNSVGDLTADLALARSGAVQTAITAIFSGPVQNCLLTLGTAFLIASLEKGGVLTIAAGLRADVHLALGLLVLAVAALLVLIPGYFRFRIPRWFGWALMACYAAYIPAGIILGLEK
jgi:sodium/potassium/calcium exchanger 6